MKEGPIIFLVFTTLGVQDIHSFWILSICHATYGMHMHFSFANQAQTAFHMHAFLHICPAYVEAWLASNLSSYALPDAELPLLR